MPRHKLRHMRYTPFIMIRQALVTLLKEFCYITSEEITIRLFICYVNSMRVCYLKYKFWLGIQNIKYHNT